MSTRQSGKKKKKKRAVTTTMINATTILLSSLILLFSHSLAHASHASTHSPSSTITRNPSHHSPPPPGPRLHINPPRQRGLVCRSDTFDDILPRSNPTSIIESIVHVPAGSSYAEPPLQNPAYPIAPSNLPELCALTVRISTSPTSSFRFGLFLPTQWNSRFLAVGNGGFAGGINWLDMGAAVRLPYRSAGGSFFATMSTDTGHNSTSGDVRWALGAPEKQKDFGYRAMHGAVEAAKKLVFAYYSTAPHRSYYAGCSTGGRQGLKEVQVSQDGKEKVFDGVLVGAPAWWSTNLATWTTKVFTYNNRDGPGKGAGYIPAGLMGAVLAKEVMRQCDGVDGVVDGIISAGDKCKLDWDKILCGKDNRTQQCLSSEQVKTAKAVYGDYVVDGQFMFPGLSVGSEDLWPVLLGQAAPDPRGQEYVKMFILNDPNWDWRTYNDSIAKMAAAMDPGDLTADGFDISKYRDRGGKIIMYHGDADGLIPVKSSDYYYNKTAAVMGGMPSLQSWFRYFRVPGLGHCSGSAVNAPWYFAGANQAGSLAGTGTSAAVTELADAQHDALLALVEWVENGREVDSITATTWKKPSDPSSGVLRQRPLCPYPKVQVLRSGADEKLAGSWKCV